MPRKATSLDEQMLLEACRFGGNDEAVAGMLRDFHFDHSVINQALIIIQASRPEHHDKSSTKTIQRLNRRLAVKRPL